MQPKFLGLLFSVEKNIVCGGADLVAFSFGWLPCKLCLTQESFRKRDKHLVNRCYMCKRDWESTDHLFLYRDCVRELWELSWMLFGCLGDVFVRFKTCWKLGGEQWFVKAVESVGMSINPIWLFPLNLYFEPPIFIYLFIGRINPIPAWLSLLSIWWRSLALAWHLFSVSRMSSPFMPLIYMWLLIEKEKEKKKREKREREIKINAKKEVIAGKWGLI